MTRFVNLLPAKARPCAKAIIPFALNLAYAGLALASTGTYDRADARANVIGLAGTLVTFLVPNKEG